MHTRKLFLALIVGMLIISSLMCDFSPSPPEETPDVDALITLVVLQITQTAMAQPPATPTDTPLAPSPTTPPTATLPQDQPPQSTTSQPGSISGQLSYPSEGIPALRVVAYNINTGYYYYLGTAPNQSSYRIDGLPAGTYHVVAYVLEGIDLSGGYTQAILCGSGPNCIDHSLVDIPVIAGQETKNVNPDDWYAPSGSFPPDPVAPPQASGDIAPATGSISGQLSYPSEAIPPLHIVAFDLASSNFYFIDTVANQSAYLIENVPPGTYHVVAYLPGANNLSAGYSQAVLCGLAANCTDHSLIKVIVYAGQETSNVSPTDWYAPEGAFPPNPMP